MRKFFAISEISKYLSFKKSSLLQRWVASKASRSAFSVWADSPTHCYHHLNFTTRKKAKVAKFIWKLVPLTIFLSFWPDWRTKGGHNLCLFSCQDYQRVVSYQDCDSTDLEIIFKPLPQQILRDQNINRMKIWKITQVAFLNDLFHFSLSVHWINWTLLIFFSLESNISRITDLKLIGCDSSQMPLIGGFSQIKLISSPSHNVTAFSEYFSCTNIPFLGNFVLESWKMNTLLHNFLEECFAKFCMHYLLDGCKMLDNHIRVV